MSTLPLTMALAPLPVSNMLNKLHGQPDSYDKKYADNTSFAHSSANFTIGLDISLEEHSVPAHMESSERLKGLRGRLL